MKPHLRLSNLESDLNQSVEEHTKICTNTVCKVVEETETALTHLIISIVHQKGIDRFYAG
jgi:hypothetical protein